MFANVGCSARLHRQNKDQTLYKSQITFNGVDGVYTLRIPNE